MSGVAAHISISAQRSLNGRRSVPFFAAFALLLTLANGQAAASDYAVKDTFSLDGPNTPLHDHRLEVDTVGGGWVQSIGADFRIGPDGLSTHDYGLDVAPGIAVIDTLVNEYDLSVTVSRESHGAVTGLVFRYVDLENHFAAVYDGSRARLVKVTGGVESVLDERPVRMDRDGRMLWSAEVRDYGIAVSVDGHRRLETDDPAFAGATVAGLIHQSVQTTSFRDFRVKADEDPPGPPPAPEPAPPVVSDSFTAPDGTPLPSHTGTEVTSGGGWSGLLGEWAISDGNTGLVAPDSERFFADQIVVIANGDVADQQISTDITWFDGNAGVVWDTADTRNYSLAFWDGQDIVVGRIDDGAFIEKGRRPALWNPGQTRNFKVRVIGDYAFVSLDGGEPILIAFGIPGPTAMNAGLFVRIDAGNRFDNFVVRPSPPLPAPVPAGRPDVPFPPVVTEPPEDAWVFDSFDSPDFTFLRHRTLDLDPAGDGWTEASGFWQVWQAQAADQSGVFGPAGFDRFAVIDTGVDEYTLEAEVEWDGGRVGILFGGRATGPHDAGRNGFIFFRNGGRMEVGRLIGGAYFEIDKTEDFNWRAGRRRVMEVEVEEGEVELKLNGDTIFEFEDPALEFSTWAGLFQRGGNFERFNDFTVALPEGTDPPAEPSIGPIADVEMTVGQSRSVSIPLAGLEGVEIELSASAVRVPDAIVIEDSFAGLAGIAVPVAGHTPERSPDGANWAQMKPGAAPTVVDGMLRVPVGGDGGDQRVVIDTGYENVEVSAQIEAINGRFGLVARHNGSTEDRNWVMGWVDAEFSLAFLARVTEGEFRLLGITPFTWTPGETRGMSLIVVGQTVSMLVNGSEVLAAEAVDLPSGTHAGVFSRKIGEDGRFLDFTAKGIGLPQFVSLDTTNPGAPFLLLRSQQRDAGSYEVLLEGKTSDGSLSTSFGLTVAPLIGPTADAGGPYVISEGLPVTLDASSSTAGNGSIVSYEWDTDGNGVANLSGQTVEFHPPGTGDHNVVLLVTDENGMSAEAAATVTVVSPHPAIDLSSLAAVGAAKMDGGRLALTPDLLWQRGAVWSPSPVPVASGFVADFTVEIVTGSPPGADGFAFVVQDSPEGPLAIGIPGAGMGYTLIKNSLAVEFDTWVNTAYGETGPHVAVHGIDSGQNSSTDATRVAMVDLPDLVRLPAVHVRVEYIPGTLRVYFEDFSAPVLETAIDLAAQLDLPAGTAYVGFTASTGGASAAHSLLSFHLGN